MLTKPLNSSVQIKTHKVPREFVQPNGDLSQGKGAGKYKLLYNYDD